MSTDNQFNDVNGNNKQEFWLYMLSNNKPSGPLYLGDTFNLIERMEDHKNGIRRDYAHYHRLDKLVYFEVWHDKEKFAARLRRVRNWPRDMRLLLVESLNPEWRNLLPELIKESNNDAKAA